MRHLLLAVFVLRAGVALAAPFTGTIEMRMWNGDHAVGTTLATVGEEGALTEVSMSPGGGPSMKMKTLMRFDKPDTVFMIDDANKAYTEAQIPASTAAGDADETWTVKKIGDEKVAGYAATHVEATSSKGRTLEMWTSTNVIDNAGFQKAFTRSAQMAGSSLQEALVKQGALGFPVKMVSSSPEGRKLTVEVVKIEKKSVAASALNVPAGYKKTTSPLLPAGALPPEAQKKLDAALKSMTPEQRAALQKSLGAH